ncbi:hypothetical protein BVC80_5569g1 [Macleaya cordata]|nr:hypothetical protein BVC80_5569g1 [Macleaya cordata]
MNYLNQPRFENQNYLLLSPQQSSSDFPSGTDFSVATVDNHDMNMKNEYKEIDENFWSEAFTIENFSIEAEFPAITTNPCLQIPTSPVSSTTSSSNLHDMDFWYNLLMEAGESLVLAGEF